MNNHEKNLWHDSLVAILITGGLVGLVVLAQTLLGAAQ